jgi:glycosyltransferase involved in cell wall biosynthesis
LLADDAQTFADSVISLLNEDEKRRRFEHAAAALAGQYDWAIIARRFEEVLVGVARMTEDARDVESLPASVNA